MVALHFQKNWQKKTFSQSKKFSLIRNIFQKSFPSIRKVFTTRKVFHNQGSFSQSRFFFLIIEFFHQQISNNFFTNRIKELLHKETNISNPHSTKNISHKHFISGSKKRSYLVTQKKLCLSKYDFFLHFKIIYFSCRGKCIRS